MLKKSSSQKPLGQFQPNMAEIIPLERGFRFVQIKGLAPFWGSIGGKIRKILINLQKSSSYEPPAGMH